MIAISCRKCGESKPATAEFFLRNPGTKSGVGSPCRDCHKRRMKIDNRQRYRGNRARGLLRAYVTSDRKAGRVCTLTEQELAVIIEQPCLYCATTDSPRGADRRDNDLGHTAENSVPCCRLCNMVRNNFFTVGEMQILGPAIAQIREMRL